MRRALTVLLVLFVGTFIASTAAAQPVKRVEYYHLDALGSVRAVTDQQGHEIARHDYLPFGEEWPQLSYKGTPLFVGKQRDSENALHYFGARYGRVEIGRFTTVDPITDFGANIADPQRWNRYAYAVGNPISFVDPDGRAPILMPSSVRVAAQSNQAWRAWIQEKLESTPLVARGVDVLASLVLPVSRRELEISTGGDLTSVGAALHISKKVGAAALAAADDVVNFHHAWPKYLGGAADQLLEVLPRAMHHEFHRGLDKVLPRRFGAQYYESLSGALRAMMLRDLSDYVKAFDSKYGTKLYDAMIREGILVK